MLLNFMVFPFNFMLFSYYSVTLNGLIKQTKMVYKEHFAFIGNSHCSEKWMSLIQLLFLCNLDDTKTNVDSSCSLVFIHCMIQSWGI